MVLDRQSWTSTLTAGVHFSHGLHLCSPGRPHLEGRDQRVKSGRCRSDGGPLRLHGSIHHWISSRRLGLSIGSAASRNACQGILDLNRCELDLQFCDCRDDAVRHSQHWVQVLHYLCNPQRSLGAGDILHVPRKSAAKRDSRRSSLTSMLLPTGDSGISP